MNKSPKLFYMALYKKRQRLTNRSEVWFVEMQV